MARSSRRGRALVLLLLLTPIVTAQLSSLPDLPQSTDGEASTTAQTTDQTNTQQTTQPTTAQTLQDDETTQTSPEPTPTTGLTGIPITDAPSLTNSGTHLSNLPTLAGVGIPELKIPYTAGAPFMQKSSLPEGTFFIAVGAALAFLGACVLLWRAMVAWSINRSVKRTATASMGSRSEKTTSYGGGWGGTTRKSSGYTPVARNSYYKDVNGSTMSLDHLTSTGKPVKPHFRDSTVERRNTPPSDLFFSPTAQASHRDSSPGYTNRPGSGHTPSGFYASPSSQPAGGQSNIPAGGTLAPQRPKHQSRHSMLSEGTSEPSPPVSPGPPHSRGSTTLRGVSRDGPLGREGSGPGLRAPTGARDGVSRHSHLYSQPSSSSLMVGGASTSDLAGSRAPSAYLEDLFENHGNGPRERF